MKLCFKGGIFGGKIVTLELIDLNAMNKTTYKIIEGKIQIYGNGLFSKEEVTVSINKAKKNTGIIFNEKILADVNNVSNSNRNTVLSNEKESICLVEHFLAACSLLGVNDLEVITDKNELVFNDGSASHWKEVFVKNNFCTAITEKYSLKEVLFVKDDKRSIVAIPHDGFKVSYFMDFSHPALQKKFASWQKSEGVEKILRARTFATKEENDYFGMSDILLTLTEAGFNKELYEPLEPVYHKILDIIGDLRLCGVNPLEINMHVIGFKSGHTLNVELAKKLKNKFSL